MVEPNRLQQALGQRPLQRRMLELGFASALLVVLTVMVVKLPPLYVFGSFGVVVATLLFFARPALGMLAYFGFRILADMLWIVPLDIGGLTILEVLSGGFTGLAAALAYVELKKVERHPVFGTLIVYLVVLTLSAVRSLDVRFALEIMAKYMSPFLVLFLTTALFRKREDWWRIMAIFAIAGAIPVTLSLYHLGTGQMSNVSLAGLNRLLGGYENLHTQGHMMLLMALIYGFWYFVLPRGWLRWAALGGAGAATLSLYLSYVRTPLLGLAIFAVLFPILSRRWRLLGAVFAAGAVVVLASETLTQRFVDLLLLLDVGNVTVDRSRLGSGRMGIWTTSMEEFMGRPIMDMVLGVGLGGHWAMVQDYVYQYRSSRGGTLGPHNDYLSLLYQLGPVSVVCYIAMQAITVRYALALRDMTRDPFVGTFASFAAALGCLVFVTNFVSNSFVERVTPGMILWSVAGMVFAMHQEASKLEANRAPPPVYALTDRGRARAPPGPSGRR